MHLAAACLLQVSCICRTFRRPCSSSTASAEHVTWKLLCSTAIATVQALPLEFASNTVVHLKNFLACSVHLAAQGLTCWERCVPEVRIARRRPAAGFTKPVSGEQHINLQGCSKIDDHQQRSEVASWEPLTKRHTQQLWKLTHILDLQWGMTCETSSCPMSNHLANALLGSSSSSLMVNSPVPVEQAR